MTVTVTVSSMQLYRASVREGKRGGKLDGQPEALWVQGYQQIPVIDPVALEVVAVGDLPQVYLLAVENLTQIHVFAFQGSLGDARGSWRFGAFG